jgi:hypothetical protein
MEATRGQCQGWRRGTPQCQRFGAEDHVTPGGVRFHLCYQHLHQEDTAAVLIDVGLADVVTHGWTRDEAWWRAWPSAAVFPPPPEQGEDGATT